MAVGKGSMERASKAVAKAPVKDAVVVEKQETAAVKKPQAKKTPAKKTPVKKASVVTGTSKEVMDKIVYQSSSQILEREVEPNESFYVGDSMPIYFY